MHHTQSATALPAAPESGLVAPAATWRRVPLWQGLLSAAPSVVVPGGTSLLEVGVPARRLVVIEDGEAEIIVGEGDDALVTGDLMPGDHAGGRCLFGYGGPPMGTVRSRGACRVSVIEGDAMDAAKLDQHPGLCGLDALVLLSLQGHLQAAMAELDRVVGQPRARGPARCAGARDSGLEAGLELLASRAAAEELPEGGVLFRPSGRDGRPEAFVVLSGVVRRLWRRAGGRVVELRPCLPGELGGFEEALGFPAAADELVAGPGTRVVRIPAARCLAALRSTDAESAAIRRAMGQASASELEELRGRVTAGWRDQDSVTTSLELDQVLMLRATVSGFPGAV